MIDLLRYLPFVIALIIAVVMIRKQHQLLQQQRILAQQQIEQARTFRLKLLPLDAHAPSYGPYLCQVASLTVRGGGVLAWHEPKGVGGQLYLPDATPYVVQIEVLPHG